MGRCSELRVIKVVTDKVATLIDDGYTIVVKSVSMSLVFYSLRHRKNGNKIVIKAYPKDNKFVQTTNGKVVAKGALIGSNHESVL